MYGTGKKKTAISRVFLKKDGCGSIIVNNIKINKYFPHKYMIDIIKLPLTLTNEETNFDIKISIKGSGIMSQVYAIKYGISKALLNYDLKYKEILRQHQLLTRDARIVERKKYGLHKSRKSHQFSKR